MLDMTNYNRLSALKDLSYSDHDIATLQSGKDSVATSRQELEQIATQLEQAMHGEALNAAQAELSVLNEQLAQQERLIDAFIGHHERVRESMRRALAAYEELPGQLVDPHTEMWVRSERRLFVEDHYVTPEAYLTVLREQANRKREEAAAAALAEMNAEIAAHTQSLAVEDGRVLDPPNKGPASDANYGNAALGAAAGSAAGAWALAGARRGVFGSIATQASADAAAGGAALAGAAGVYRRPPASGPGSRHEPINDPEALRHLDLYKTPLNPRMSSDGPIGGYLPAQVTDGTDPRWSSEAARSAAPSSRASMSAGILGGAGAAVGAGSMRLAHPSQPTSLVGREGLRFTPSLGAGNAHSGSVSTASSMSGLTGPAASTTPGGVSGATSTASGAAGLARSFGAPGVGAGVGASSNVLGAANTTGSATVANGVRPFGAPGAPGVGASTPGAGPTTGMPGAPGAYAPGAAGTATDRKDENKRVGYQVIRVRDDERRPVKLSDGAGPGDSASMKPMSFNDADDSWE